MDAPPIAGLQEEHERKYLVRAPSHWSEWEDLFGPHEPILQAYLLTGPTEVRIRWNGSTHIVQTKEGRGEKRWESPPEFGHVHPVLGDSLLRASGHNYLEKKRFRSGGWDIDFYLGPLEGLAVIEWERTDEFPSQPPFPPRVDVIREITDEDSFKNQALAVLPRASAESFVLHAYA